MFGTFACVDRLSWHCYITQCSSLYSAVLSSVCGFAIRPRNKSNYLFVDCCHSLKGNPNMTVRMPAMAKRIRSYFTNHSVHSVILERQRRLALQRSPNELAINVLREDKGSAILTKLPDPPEHPSLLSASQVINSLPVKPQLSQSLVEGALPLSPSHHHHSSSLHRVTKLPDPLPCVSVEALPRPLVTTLPMQPQQAANCQPLQLPDPPSDKPEEALCSGPDKLPAPGTLHSPSPSESTVIETIEGAAL